MGVEEVYPTPTHHRPDAEVEPLVILVHRPGSEGGEIALLHLLDLDHRLRTGLQGEGRRIPDGEGARGLRKAATRGAIARMAMFREKKDVAAMVEQGLQITCELLHLLRSHSPRIQTGHLITIHTVNATALCSFHRFRSMMYDLMYCSLVSLFQQAVHASRNAFGEAISTAIFARRHIRRSGLGMLTPTKFVCEFASSVPHRKDSC